MLRHSFQSQHNAYPPPASTGSGQVWEGGWLRDGIGVSPLGDIVPVAKRSGGRERGLEISRETEYFTMGSNE
jgi:hypothetical protein